MMSMLAGAIGARAAMVAEAADSAVHLAPSIA
jgi:hypothetical protein